MQFDYIYGDESEQYAFYRIPKLLFTADVFTTLTPEAKILYGILLDRVTISLKNGWMDAAHRVFIIFTLEEIMEYLNCGNKKAVKLLNELEAKAGLIERKRQGLGRPSLIYVKNFVRALSKKGQDALRFVDNSVDNPGITSKGHFLKCQNDTSGDVKMTHQEVSKGHGNKTDKNKTDMSKTDNHIYQEDAMDTMVKQEDMQNQYGWYRRYFQEALDYNSLLQHFPYDRKMLEGILELLVDTCASDKEDIRIGGSEIPKEVVRGRLMKLNYGHIQYVMDCLRENTAQIRNIRQYLLSVLYNAPGTLSAYYQAKVQHDSYGAS